MFKLECPILILISVGFCDDEYLTLMIYWQVSHESDVYKKKQLLSGGHTSACKHVAIITQRSGFYRGPYGCYGGCFIPQQRRFHTRVYARAILNLSKFHSSTNRLNEHTINHT